MIYRYFDLRNLTWKILIECKINTLPINLEKICENYNINLNIYDNKEICKEYKQKNIKGFSFINNETNQPQIYYNNDLPQSIKRFTIAHELSHFLLKHFYKFENIDLEKEANSMASRLLCPICLIKELNLQTPEEVAKTFNISLTTAKFRIERYFMLLKRNKFYTNNLEKQVIKQFKNYIKENKKQ